jgi:hypothetical protein
VYTDLKNVYFQRSIETIVSNDKRLYHTSKNKEYILNNKVAIVAEDNVFYFRDNEESKLTGCYGVYNGFVTAFSSDYRIDNFVIFSPRKTGYAFRSENQIYLLSE